MSGAEVWPRWLPSPGLRSRETHHVARPGGTGACGAVVMWATVGHPTTTRPRCWVCERIVGTRTTAPRPSRSTWRGPGSLRNQKCTGRTRR